MRKVFARGQWCRRGWRQAAATRQRPPGYWQCSTTASTASYDSPLLAAQAQWTVAVDGKASATAMTPHEFLAAQPPGGAYTTARTSCGGTKLFEWTTHVDRTASSVAAVLSGSVGAGIDSAARHALIDAIGTSDALRPRLEQTVGAAVALFRNRQRGVGSEPAGGRGAGAQRGVHGGAAPAPELRVSAFVGWDAATLRPRVAAHVSPLPPPPPRPVRAEVRGAPRGNAAAKTAAWIAERAPNEALMRAAEVGAGGINEFLLSTGLDASALAIYEGSQTNFFAVVGGAVHTAPDGTVLAGTVRRLTLEVCARAGIEVVMQAPVLAAAAGCGGGDAGEGAACWEGAMLSSTSRLLLPVDELYMPHAGEPTCRGDLLCAFDNDAPGALAPRLAQLVRQEVEAHSEPIAGVW